MTDVLVTPAFQSLATDSGDPTKLGPNAWNAARLFSSGGLGDLVSRDPGSATGASWLSAAAGVLMCAGAAQMPAFSLTPSVTDLTLGGTLAWSTDLKLTREAANTLAIANGTTPVSVLVFRTRTDASNYERIAIVPGTTHEIRAENGGSGSYRPIQVTGGTVTLATGSTGGAATGRWRVDASGHLLAVASGQYDFGATNANRPNNAHLAGYMAIGDGITAPGAGTGEARIYVDAADGDLKVVFADGTIKTLTVDT